MSTSLERTAIPPAAPGPGHLSRHFMLRLAGLPVEAVQSLRSPAARRWADEVLAEEDRLRQVGALLSGPLAAFVTDNTDDRMRRQVLDLRRRVFNNRLPKDGPAALALAARLDAATARELTGWLRDRAALEALRARGPELLTAELARGRAALRELAAEDQLRLGLLLASPTLDGQLDAYIRGASSTAGKRGRKIERSLLAYLYRTACKTSPFSTFTGVALGELQDAAGPHDAADGVTDIAERWSSHPRLNVVVLWRLAEAVAADGERRGDLLVSLASGWELDEERVRFVRRSVTPGDDDAAISFDAARDRLFFLRRSGALEAMLTLFRDRPGIRYRELAHWLTTERGATAEEAGRYLSALLQLGMVQLSGLYPEVHSPDPLRAFQSALRAVGRPWADAAAARLDGPASCVQRYADAPLADRRALLAELRRDLLDLLASLGPDGPAAERSPHQTLPQTLLYEDARAAHQVTGGDLRTWTELAADPLRSLTRILPAFDVSLAQRLTFKGFFLARYGRGGRCDDLLKLVHDFHEDIFDQYLSFSSQQSGHDPRDGHPLEENWLGLPQITALDAARATFVRRMRALWEEHAPDAEELRLDDAFVEAVAAELAPLARSFDPQSHFLQLVRRDEDPLVVLNGSFGGLCFPFTRFTHCFDTPADDPGLSERLLGTLRGVQPDGALFAEITAGSATTNLNLHGRLTDYQILCPGETSSAPQDSRIDLDDLYVEHDAAADRLVVRSRRLGKEIIPLYLGYLVPMVLPEIPRTLLLLSPTSKTGLDVWTGVPAAAAYEGVTLRPRVRHGSVVLSRRGWSAPSAALPQRPTGQGDADWFLGWQRWRHAHRVPGQVFATVRAGDGTGQPAGWGGGSKPHYVDFESPLSLVAFEGLLGDRTTRVLLEEMLPAEDQLHVRSARGRHVAELAVEIFPGRPPHPITDREGHGERT
ncbi:lantibiotic dehydratase [Streptomyces sp. H39-S7]|uniref:lantibiotic dehydratase n=1 Tax=Streptomyces sp. H39-S7 TaxID=3004357 RepID=UPI0022AEB342|nr:lantibiotic dehydratase [Streptomyces sp. H39-S7]MCZ4124578.1 lantibiotic dehydratase [Streptomyces sp. H39-S7]